MKNIAEISTAKRVDDAASIIGHNPAGGVFFQEGKLVALKHNIHRHNGSGTWGRADGGFTEADLMEVGFQISPFPTPKDTRERAQKSLDEIRSGEIPKWLTVGMEVEGAVYDAHGTNLLSVYEDCGVDVNRHPHPELLAFTLETASTPIAETDYARNPVDIAHSLATTLLEGHAIAARGNGLIAYASVAEGGTYTQAKITPHPYLISFAPKVLNSTLEQANSIPEEVITLYQQAGIDILYHLQTDQILNWPTHAFHVHTGLPSINALADPRAAFATGSLRLTEFAKVVSLMLSNTRHLYGVDTQHRDVRSIIRRLLPTSHDATIPTNAVLFLKEAIGSLINGEIHSLPRFPSKGQHDRLRLRIDADKKTVESIDAPMNPDVRLLLAWTFFNQVLSIIALDALAQPEVAGDESRVIPYLKKTYGPLFSVIPTMGSGSSYEQDLHFDQAGYSAKSNIEGKRFEDLLVESSQLLQSFAKKYLALKTQIDVVSAMIDRQLQKRQEIDLLQFFGVESDRYHPSDLNRGIITDYKTAPVSDIIYTQSRGNRLQAEALLQIRDTADLYSFFGIT